MTSEPFLKSNPKLKRDLLKEDLGLKDLIAMFGRNKRIIFLCLFFGISVSLASIFLSSPLYRATATVRIDTMSMGQSFLTETLSPASRNLIGTEIAIIQSRSIVQSALEGLDLASTMPPSLENSFDDFVTLIREDYLSATAPRNADIVHIQGRWYGPEQAAAMANLVAENYITANVTRKQAEAKKAREFLDKQIDKIKNQLHRAEQTFSLRETKVNETLYQSLLQKRENAQIQENTTLGDVWMVDPAIAPVEPFKPDSLVNLTLGIIGGLIAGLVWAAIREHFDDRIHGPADAEQAIDSPILGIIPWIPFSKNGQLVIVPNGKSSDTNSLSKRLITSIGMHSPIVEAYRGLRTSLLYTETDKPHKVLLITSCGPSEGKTLTTINLALAIAQMGQKVAVIDADMRKPKQHELLKVAQKPGLSDFLSGQAKLNSILKPSKDKSIHVIPAGKTPPNPPELLSGPRMPQLVRKLKKTFDYIIFDSPPILFVTDPAVLLQFVDGVVLIVRAEQTDKGELAEASRLLTQTPTPILGTVLNALTPKGHGYGYGRYNYYGIKSYSSDDGTRKTSS